MKLKTKSKIVQRGALLFALALLCQPAQAGRYTGVVWEDGDGRWYYGVRDKSCKTSDCVQGKGFTTTKKDARKKAKEHEKKANLDAEDAPSRGEGPGRGA